MNWGEGSADKALASQAWKMEGTDNPRSYAMISTRMLCHDIPCYPSPPHTLFFPQEYRQVYGGESPSRWDLATCEVTCPRSWTDICLYSAPTGAGLIESQFGSCWTQKEGLAKLHPSLGALSRGLGGSASLALIAGG